MLLLTVGLELLLYKGLWKFRNGLAVVIVLLIGVSSGLVVSTGQPLWMSLLLLVNVFRVINLARVVKARMHEKYLHRVCMRTGLFLATFLMIILGAGRLFENANFFDVVLFASAIQLVVAIVVVATTARNLHKTRHRPTAHYYSDTELPSVTIAIPARNETAELTSCLTSILANDYPKLEVLVLDDCSQDKTSEIIKSFAKDGVRFLKGTDPRQRWLAKNHAYDQLAKAASGKYIIFCGVDVRFGPSAVRSLVSDALRKKRSMISVMPIRYDSGIQTSFIQPLRYWWELALPRRIFNRPPVLSTCWLIKRDVVSGLGGFAAVAHTIIPEGYFARELIKHDRYTFVRADEELDVRTIKSPAQQLELSLRMRYPQLRRRPENVISLLIAETFLLLGPLVTIIIGIWTGFGTVQYLAVGAYIMLLLNHVVIVASSNPANSITALLNYPFVILTELFITVVSFYRYEFGEILWKDRNICIPVMHTIPKLPDIKP